MKKRVIAMAVVAASQPLYAAFKVEGQGTVPVTTAPVAAQPAPVTPQAVQVMPGAPVAPQPSANVRALESEVEQLRNKVRMLEKELAARKVSEQEQTERLRLAQEQSTKAQATANDAIAQAKASADARAQAEAIASKQAENAARAEHKRHVSDAEGLNAPTFSFAPGSVQLSAKAQADRAFIAQAKAARSIEVSGYTDSTGSASANERVARMRANAVKLYLIQQGVPADKITVVGRSGVYAASNDSASGRAANRRAVISMGYS